MLNDVKKIMGINNTEFDSIINNYITAAKEDLKAVGIVSSLVVETDALIYSAIVSYILSMLDVPNAELYSNAYALQKDALRHNINYITESGD